MNNAIGAGLEKKKKKEDWNAEMQNVGGETRIQTLTNYGFEWSNS